MIPCEDFFLRIGMVRILVKGNPPLQKKKYTREKRNQRRRKGDCLRTKNASRHSSWRKSAALGVSSSGHPNEGRQGGTNSLLSTSKREKVEKKE